MTASLTAAPTWVHAYVLDPAERAVSTFVEQFVVLVLPFIATGVAVKLTGVPWLGLLDMAGFAGVISLITSAATFAVPKLAVGYDLVLRALKTFIQAFLGVMVAAGVTPSLVHAPWQVAFATAFPVAAAALLKGLAALAAPWSAGASLLPLSPALYNHDDAGPVETGGGNVTPWDMLDSSKASSPPELPAAPMLGRHSTD